MHTDVINNILRKGEGLTIEFKKASKELPRNLFETVCAFLNRQGGTMLLGVSDEGKVLGVDENKVDQLCKNFANLSNNPSKLSPVFLLQPTIVELDGKKIIHVFVPSSSQVHKTNSKYYDRSVDGDFVVTTHAKISELYARKSAIYSENTIYPYLHESDFEDNILDKARKLIKIQRPNHPWNELNNQEFFKVAGLYRKDVNTGEEGFTMTALLLFGKEHVITSVIPHYKTDALLRVKDTDRYDDRITIRCNLIDAYDQLMQFIQKHLPDKFYLENNQRISLRDTIFREVIANTLIHREFKNANPSSLVIYSDKVVIKNANKPYLLGQLLPNDYTPYPKNPNIAQFFTQIGRSEELGSGIKKVYKFSKEYSNSDALAFIEEDLFISSIPLGNLIIKDEENVPLNDRMKYVIDRISTHKNINVEELSIHFQVSEKTIKRDMAYLKKNKIIKHVGSKKTGYWQLIDQE